MAQLVEQRIRNAQVAGSSPATSSSAQRAPRNTAFCKIAEGGCFYVTAGYRIVSDLSLCFIKALTRRHTKFSARTKFKKGGITPCALAPGSSPATS